MALYRCPQCERRGADWDARSGAFLCLFIDCGWSSPFLRKCEQHREVAEAILRSDESRVQAWIDAQPNDAEAFKSYPKVTAKLRLEVSEVSFRFTTKSPPDAAAKEAP